MEIKFKNAYLFGDSIARGIALDETTGKYISLADSFASISAKLLGIGLINKAKFGCTITKGKDVIFKTIENLNDNNHYDYAVLEFGGNDCDYNWIEVANFPSEIHSPKTSLKDFVDTYKQIVVYLKSKNIIPVLLTLPPIASDYYFEWIGKKIPNKDNILNWLGGNIENIYYWQERYNSAVWEVAATTNSSIVDIRKAFLEVKDYKNYLCNDGIHLNQKGHELASEIILDSINKFKTNRVVM